MASNGIKAKSDKTWFGVVFAVIGVILLGVAIFFFVDYFMTKSDYVEVPAVISHMESYRDPDGDLSYRVYVDFTFEGRAYENVSLGEYMTGMYEGKSLTLQVNQNDPLDVRTTAAGYILPLVLFAMGAVFSAVGGVLTAKTVRAMRVERTVRQFGVPMQCVVTGVQVDTSYRVNGRHVRNYLICTPVKGPDVRFQSPPFSRRNLVNVGSKITVYVLQEDISSYWVDLSSLQPVAYSDTTYTTTF